MTDKQLKAESKTSESDLHTNREVIQTVFVYMDFCILKLFRNLLSKFGLPVVTDSLTV